MTINIGIIGTGRIADMQLAPALAQVSGARLWSVLSRSAETASAFAGKHRAAAPSPAHDSLDDFLSDPELTAVVIATPDALHASQAIACARAGKHILLEKPMATSVADAAAINAACADAGVQLGIAYHLRWHAGHRIIADKLHSGELGSPRYARALWTWQADDNSNWRAHAELGQWWSLAGVGTHCIDLVRWMLLPMCGEVSSLSSVIDQSTYGGPHDETACLSLQFNDQAIADVTTSVMFTAESRFELFCTRASVICESTLGPSGAGSITINGEPLQFDETNPYVGEIQNLVDAIEGRAQIAVDGEEGLRNVELLMRAVA